MKTILTLSVDVDTATALREAAAEGGCGYSELANLLLRKGLDALVPERLKSWTTQRRAAPEGPRLRGSERLVLSALRTEWQSASELAARAGHSQNIVRRALERLVFLNLAEESADEIPDHLLVSGDVKRQLPYLRWRLATKAGEP